MHTRIHERFEDTREADVARSILRSCVHCGFCNATCPTYLELGDERDGPRGRIYLIKQLLESGSASKRTQTHLDRCLTCRNCETTCPSGVQYGRLLDVGRGILERDLNRTWGEKLRRNFIKLAVPYPRRFAFLLSLARALRFALPPALRAKLPRNHTADRMPGGSRQKSASTAALARSMIVLEGCAQAAATPATNAAARSVFGRLGIDLVSAPQAGCCGALHYHLGEHAPAGDFMRANIDAWWPLIERGAEAIVITASGCGTSVKEYGEMLADDARYAEKAARIASLARDIAEVLETEDLGALQLSGTAIRYALHCPCSLQHGQQFGDRLERLLTRLGLRLTETRDAHLCCGSAGSYSLLQPELSQRLLKRKIAALTLRSPETILTANVGCQLHLASATDVPVRHWIEAIDLASAEVQRSK
ncbi:MAG: glycolate oxidase subunit GlcF [Gammaproteobacteria bacterium]|jgi:glycolate oxidase iron-sulfur subunit